MTTKLRPLPTSLSRWRRRLTHTWRTLFSPGDWLALLLPIGVLVLPILALERAGWPLLLATTLPTVALSVVFGFLLARSQYNELLALLMSAIYGMGLVLLIASINADGDLLEGFYSVVARLLRWFVDAFTGGINQDDLVFTILVSLLFWFLGYNAAWHLFRVDRVWRAIIPPGLILVTNSLYYAGPENLDGYLIVYVFLALLLVVRSNIEARLWEWYVNGVRVPGQLRTQLFRIGALLALVVVIGAWLVPSADLQERLNNFQEFMQSEPLTQLSELWSRLFSTVEMEGPTTADYYGGDSLQLGGAIQLGEQTVLLVAAPPGRRYYWRSRVFDTYESGRWTPAADIRLTDEQTPLDIVPPPDTLLAREAVQQEFTVALNASRLIYTAPQPLRVDVPSRTDLRYTTNREGMNISVIRPITTLERGTHYTATSLMSSASAAQLRSAGTAYPAWVTDFYLQLSSSTTDRTRELARIIVQEAGAQTPYDQARAIESWLRTNIQYEESIPQPPRNQDPVDWVLFDLKQGYCNYYASAMIVMLRSLGIPARMAAGFAQGQYDPAQNAYVVLERDAHTWVEVFFPGYGWIEFEPTAAQAPINRVDDTPAEQQPTPTPPPSPTPTLTPSPSPAPTENLQPTPEGQQAVPTITPTFTPTATATPVIVPTFPPPLAPQARGPLAFLLPALGLALAVLLLIIVVVGLLVFLWWWWEWRGMRGLSPIARAYARLERYIGLIGVRFNPQQTPEERRRQVAKQLPKAEPPVTAITRLYTVERYGRGRHPQDAETQDEIAEEAWSDTRGNILKRWLRRLLPWNRGK
ncbi:MAG: hypothetical protein H6672_01560 [Anaerolineaceae bacterium]|nr:hypothetical protein [Anaerolineaceae bacterium]